MSLQPQASIFPPCGFIATAMGLAMMAPAQRHRELIADLSAERAMLREAQMVCVCGPARANQKRLFGREPDVLLDTKRRGSGWAMRLRDLRAQIRDFTAGDRLSREDAHERRE
jgi:hypothetical protein